MIWKAQYIGGMTMPFDKTKYDIEYARAHIKCKRIPFNDQKQEDAELLEWLGQQGNVTQYVKRLIREDMESKQIVFPEESLSKWLSELKDEPQDD